MSLDVCVGGAAVRLRGVTPACAAALERRYAGFVRPAPRPAITLDLAVAPPADDFAEIVERDCEVVADGDRVIVRGPRFCGWIDPAARRGALDTRPALGPIDALVRAALSLALLEREAVVVHAAGIARGDRALVFAGPSGAGKTTLVRALGGTLLADELVVLQVTGQGLVAAGTPFWSGVPVTAPLGGLFLLARGGPPGLRPLPPAAAVPALWREVGRYLPLPHLERRWFEILGEILRRAPPRALTLPEDRTRVRAHAVALLGEVWAAAEAGA